MTIISHASMTMRSSSLVLAAALVASMPGSAWAQQQQDQPAPPLKATMDATPDSSAFAPGPEIKGIITARSSDRMQVTADDGTKTSIAINDSTRITASKGFLGIGRSKLGAKSLLNGLPVTVRTLQSGDALLASQVTLRNTDLKVATMIRGGTAQGFEEQTAATEALRGRVGDIDQYNIKATTNVNFDTGKAVLSERAKADLCAAAASAEATKNALLLVVGYTDATGNDEYNQTLSERRAARVVNYMQQACGWKPYRMLTPTGMAKADPLASNDSPDGKAQNRRVAVNILVSKGLDGM